MFQDRDFVETTLTDGKMRGRYDLSSPVSDDGATVPLKPSCIMHVSVLLWPGILVTGGACAPVDPCLFSCLAVTASLDSAGVLPFRKGEYALKISIPAHPGAFLW